MDQQVTAHVELLAAGFLDLHVGDEVAHARGRLLGMGQRGAQPLDARSEEGLVVVEEGHLAVGGHGVGPVADRLARRHPVAGIVGEEVEPLLEAQLAQQAHLAVEKLLNAVLQRGVDHASDPTRAHRAAPPSAGRS